MQRNTDAPIVHINLIQKGETAAIKLYQKGAFQKEIGTLENGRVISSQRSISKLDPSLDVDGVLRVGGKINKTNLDYCLKDPVLLKKGHITHAIIRDYHEKVPYVGRGMTINEIRKHGY